MEICDKILHSYAMYCRKELVKIFKCYLIPKKSYGTLSKGAIFFGQSCVWSSFIFFDTCYISLMTKLRNHIDSFAAFKRNKTSARRFKENKNKNFNKKTDGVQ